MGRHGHRRRRPGLAVSLLAAFCGSVAIYAFVSDAVDPPHYAPAARPTATAPPVVIARWTGHGNQVTSPFLVPRDGSYIVRWSYSRNATDDGFGPEPDNFIIDNTGDGIGMGLPNDILTSGSGSTEVTDGDGSDRLNIQATGSWTVTVTTG